MKLKNIKNFFQLKTKASAELEDEVKAELKVEDPSTERAKAILKGDDDDERPAN